MVDEYSFRSIPYYILTPYEVMNLRTVKNVGYIQKLSSTSTKTLHKYSILDFNFSTLLPLLVNNVEEPSFGKTMKIFIVCCSCDDDDDMHKIAESF